MLANAICGAFTAYPVLGLEPAGAAVMTWENPRAAGAACGFASRREQRLAQMLAFRDVHGPPR